MGVCASKGVFRQRGRRRNSASKRNAGDDSTVRVLDAEAIAVVNPSSDGATESPYVVTVVAMFSFDQLTEEDLSFNVGDRFVVDEREWNSDANWVNAFSTRTRENGLIPTNYVRELRDELMSTQSRLTRRPQPRRGRQNLPIMDRLRENLQISKPQVVVVNREDAVNDFVANLPQPGFHLGQKIQICFLGEEGVDQGGLTRDMASAILRHLQNSQVLEGPIGHTCLSHSLGALARQEYLRAGELVAYVLCHAGMACPLFSDSLVRLLCAEGPQDRPRKDRGPWLGGVVCEVDDVPDAQFREKLKEIEGSEFPCRLAEDVAEEIGYYDPLNAAKKRTFLNVACQYYLYHRCRSEIEQFKAGLDELGVLDVLRDNPEEAQCVLCGSHMQPVTADEVFQMFVIQWGGANESVERQEEEVASFEFQFFLQDCEKGDCECSLPDVLYFLTGTRAIPPGGFKTRATLRFARVPYPLVSTCTLDLVLPLSLPPNKTLKDVMTLAVSSPEFAVA